MSPLRKSTLPSRDSLTTYLAAAWLVFALAVVGGCGKAEKPASEKPGPTADQEAPADAQPPSTAEGVLQKMVAAYQNASSYADTGTVRLLADSPDGKIDDTAKFALTMVRPNKIRMEVYQAMVVCDGQQLHAAIEDLPGQVLVKEAPEKLTMRSVYTDRVLAATMSRGFAGASPQLMLMLADDPLKVLQQDAQEIILGEPGNIEGRPYHRVEIMRPDGRAVFWIDQHSYALRRIVFPTTELLRMLAREGEVHSVSLVADMHNAQLNTTIGPEAFRFEVPAAAELVKFFVPPHPAQLLGKKVPAFKFVDLAGNQVTPASLAGKIAVLDFWATWCTPCRASLPILSKVRQQYVDNGGVTMFAVSVDQPEVENKTLQDTFTELGVQVPMLRDMERNASTIFNTTGIPATFILDAAGVVQDYEIGGNPQLATVLPEKLDKLLAGQNIFQEPLAAYQKELEEYERSLDAPPEEQTPGEGAQDTTIEVPEAKIAQRTEPKTFRLSPLWNCTELTSPGNVLAVSSADGRPRLLVVDNWKSGAEIGPDGKLVANHQPAIDPREAMSNLRTAAGSDGRRYFAATSFAQQRYHLFDQDFKLLGSYPQDALENPHPGIADVMLGDLEGDGRIKAYVAYRDVVGVKAVSLTGELLWSNRAVIDVSQMAIGGPDAQGSRQLLCTNNSGGLAVVDAKGMRLEDIMVTWRFLHRISAADLTGDGQPEWCGMAVAGPGKNVAVGLNLKGEELWNYPLPDGVHRQPIELITPGQLSASVPGQWLLPGADGSIHILGADGRPLDQFNYGVELHGLATARFNGQPVLIVSSANGVEALRVE